MSQTDPFADFAKSPLAVADRHFAIVPDDDNDLPIKPRVVYCHDAGTIVIRDSAGGDLPYAMTAGQVLPLRPVRVLSSGTSGTFYGWF